MSEVKRYKDLWIHPEDAPEGQIFQVKSEMVGASDFDALSAQLAEARAELAKLREEHAIVCREVHDGELNECRLERERDALRAAIENCNGECGCTAYKLLPAASQGSAPLPGSTPLSDVIAKYERDPVMAEHLATARSLRA